MPIHLSFQLNKHQTIIFHATPLLSDFRPRFWAYEQIEFEKQDI